MSFERPHAWPALSRVAAAYYLLIASATGQKSTVVRTIDYFIAKPILADARTSTVILLPCQTSPPDFDAID
jgi:hypothetical protein